MNVKEFVTDALVQIASGVDDANNRFAEANIDALANPPGGKVESQRGTTHLAIPDVQMIQFDIAVTVEAQTNTQGNAGIGISVLTLGTQGETSKSNANVSRIQFKIPLRLPMQPKT